MSTDQIKEEIRKYILDNIVQDDSKELKNDTLLISGGVIDSISTLKMVSFLEKRFAFEFMPHEVDRENLDSINLIADFVVSKM